MQGPKMWMFAQYNILSINKASISNYAMVDFPYSKGLNGDLLFMLYTPLDVERTDDVDDKEKRTGAPRTFGDREINSLVNF